MASYPTEEIYEVYWEGPFTLEELKKHAKKEPDLAKNWTLYTKYENHPLYGRDVLTYIGMASAQDVVTRLGQHDLDREKVFVGIIFKFESWEDSKRKWEEDWDDLLDYIVKDKPTILAIESLLIFALWPAGNLKNRKSAKDSWRYRIFNTGYLGSLPHEVSGHYTFEKLPQTLKQAEEDE